MVAAAPGCTELYEISRITVITVIQLSLKLKALSHLIMLMRMHAYIHTERQAGRQAGRQADGQTDMYIYIYVCIYLYICQSPRVSLVVCLCPWELQLKDERLPEVSQNQLSLLPSAITRLSRLVPRTRWRRLGF